MNALSVFHRVAVMLMAEEVSSCSSITSGKAPKATTLTRIGLASSLSQTWYSTTKETPSYQQLVPNLPHLSGMQARPAQVRAF